MKIISRTLIAAMMIASACSGPAPKTAGVDYSNMDTTVRPGDDFAGYATGLWAINNPQPPEYARWGSFDKLRDDNTKTLAGLIQDIASSKSRQGSIEQKIGDLYNMAMDSTRRNEEGNAPLLAELAKIQALETREALIEHSAVEHDNLLFGVYVGADDKNSSENIVHIFQGGLSLNNRDYYLSKDPKTVEIRDAFRRHGENLFVLAGFSEDEARAKMAVVMDIQTSIAEPSFSKEQQRDPEANYHKMSVEEMSGLCGGFDWRRFLDLGRYDRTFDVNLAQPAPVARACEILMTAPLEDLRTIYEFDIISGAAAYLSDAFVDENFDFSRKLTGAKEKKPRWKTAVDLTNSVLSEAVGQMYVRKFFPPQAKTEMEELVGKLQEALGNRIKAQEWMSDETKAVALDKLAAFYVKVGYPDTWDDLGPLVIDSEKSLYENMIAASRFRWELDYAKHYNKPVDRTEWLMSPQTVNAYYNPATNEICFPAGILQPPFFNLNADAAANLGAIGVVIGHEMTHGFDDQGRQFDKDGNLNQWWNDADIEAFQKPADQLAEFFNTLWVIPGDLHANGVLCLGENIADHGGLSVSFEALRLWQEAHGRIADDNGFTPEQRFFLSYATLWAGVTSEEMLRYLTMTDVHSCQRLRVNGALAQFSPWYEAFGIQPGDALYVAPEDRVNIW